MKRSSEEPYLVAVHTRLDATVEKLDLATDHGRFSDDFAQYGLDLVITNLHTFTEGKAQIVTRSETTRRTRYSNVFIDPQSIQAMYGRVIAPITRSNILSDIPKINSNELKRLSSSKIDLYTKILSSDQVPTWLLSMHLDDYEESVDTVHAISGDTVVLKANRGSGGATTKIYTKKEAVAWIDTEMQKQIRTPQILQPEIKFGLIPDGVNGLNDYGKILIKRSRNENLLTELRMFTIKRDDEFDTVPVLRIVPNKNLPMKGHNDDYIDVDLPLEMYETLRSACIRIINKACEEAGKHHSGDRFAVGTIDFYFDEKGLPRVGEANFRSPQLPTTNETPIAGRAVFQSMAKTLHAMTCKNKA